MFCSHCGGKMDEDSQFCTHCGKEVVSQYAPAAQAPSPAQRPVQPSPAAVSKNPKGKYLLFGACGTAVGAILLAVILLLAGVFSGGGTAGVFSSGGKIEGSGFDTPEDAANAYLMGLKDGDMDAMLSAFAVESYVEHYDLEAVVERLKSYQPNLEIRLPNSNEYNQRLNVVTRRNQIANLIMVQYMFYQAPDELSDYMPIMFSDSQEIQDFIDKFERDTENYIFEDLEITGTLEPEDFTDLYTSPTNQENIARQAKTFGADEDDVANIAVKFEADGQTWIFCPQLVRYDGKWYLQSAQGNLAILIGMSVYTGGIMPLDEVVF